MARRKVKKASTFLRIAKVIGLIILVVPITPIVLAISASRTK